MIRFPYGIADFRRIRQQGRVYVDRTAHIRDIEDLGDVLVFLRPRRFGKSLWIQTLATYYDLRYAEQFDAFRRFGDRQQPHAARQSLLRLAVELLRRGSQRWRQGDCQEPPGARHISGQGLHDTVPGAPPWSGGPRRRLCGRPQQHPPQRRADPLQALSLDRRVRQLRQRGDGRRHRHLSHPFRQGRSVQAALQVGQERHGRPGAGARLPHRRLTGGLERLDQWL
ncbi:MAG: AAA family ATPase, partial [bacterium]|nr:AAA family ATPase [bacterium]